MSKLGFFSDPHVQYVSQVIEEILAGNLQIPKFQRPYMWDWDRRLDLFRSIQVGIPMGAIMVWRTSGEQLKTYRNFGSIHFKEPFPVTTHQYLLDGVQRLSTLVSALTLPIPQEGDVPEESLYQIQEVERNAFFDLQANDFIALKSTQCPEPYHMPLHLLSNGIDLIRFQRGLEGVNANKWIMASDALAKAFREYKIPVIPIVTDDIALASQTFQRINSAGLQMGEKDMLHALTYSANFDFSDELDEFRDSLDIIGWGKLDDDLLLKLVKAGLELDVYKAGVDSIGKAIRAQPDILKILKLAIESAAKFFEEKLGMVSPDFIPYGFHIVGVAEAFRVSHATNLPIPPGLDKWIWLTTYTEYFTGLSGDKVSNQLDLIRTSVRSQFENMIPLEPSDGISFQTKARFDFRSARSRAFAVSLARTMDEASTKNGTDLLTRYGRSAVVTGIPRERFRDPSSYLSPGNRFLVDPSWISKFRVEMSSDVDPGPEFSASHGIPSSGRDLIHDGEFDTMVRERHLYLATKEAEFFSKVMELR
jgi:hypothetical protein